MLVDIDHVANHSHHSIHQLAAFCNLRASSGMPDIPLKSSSTDICRTRPSTANPPPIQPIIKMKGLLVRSPF